MKKIDVGCWSYIAQVGASALAQRSPFGQVSGVNGAGERQIAVELSLLCGT